MPALPNGQCILRPCANIQGPNACVAGFQTPSCVSIDLLHHEENDENSTIHNYNHSTINNSFITKIIDYMIYRTYTHIQLKMDYQINQITRIYDTKAVARGVPQVHVHPPFQNPPQNYFLCRIIRFVSDTKNYKQTIYIKQRTFDSVAQSLYTENSKKFILYKCSIDGFRIEQYLRQAFPSESTIKKNTAKVRHEFVTGFGY